jgi:heme-degrading monooxygenase HmoA
MDERFARTPTPPYYAVIFTSARSSDDRGYSETAQRMVALASEVPGFLGVESVRAADGLGITVSYWASEEAIAAWRENAEHLVAQRHGRERWYDAFSLRVAKVERAYGKDPVSSLCPAPHPQDRGT